MAKQIWDKIGEFNLLGFGKVVITYPHTELTAVTAIGQEYTHEDGTLIFREGILGAVVRPVHGEVVFKNNFQIQGQTTRQSDSVNFGKSTNANENAQLSIGAGGPSGQVGFGGSVQENAAWDKMKAKEIQQIAKLDYGLTSTLYFSSQQVAEGPLGYNCKKSNNAYWLRNDLNLKLSVISEGRGYLHIAISFIQG